jgi:hypothetical protein
VGGITIPFPDPPEDLPSDPVPAFLVGLGCWFAAFRILPPEGPAGDRGPSPWAARGILGLILAGAAYLRLSHFRDPYPWYWDDMALTMVDVQAILDYHLFQFIFFMGDRQPVYQYVTALVTALTPFLNLLEAQRLAWGLMDLVTVWLLYLVGKEAVGRRTGLLLAGLAAVDRPFLVNCLSGQSCIIAPVGVALGFLFTLRFLRRPDHRHAVQWGLAVAFSAYCYQSARPFLWGFPMLVLLAFLARPEGRKGGARAWFLLLGGAAAWTFWFFRYNRFLPEGFLGGGWLVGPWAQGAFLVAWLLAGSRSTPRWCPGSTRTGCSPRPKGPWRWCWSA